MPASANRILQITGGSKKTVVDHLQAIRGSKKPENGDLDRAGSFLHAAAEPFLKKIQAAARQQAGAEFEGRIRDLVAIQAGLLEDVRDLAETNAALVQRAEAVEAGAASDRAQDEQLARLIEMVERLKAGGVGDEQQRRDVAPVPPDRLPLMWQLVSILQGRPTLQGSKLEAALEAAGFRERQIHRAKSDALQEGLLALEVTQHGRDMLKALENLPRGLSANSRRACVLLPVRRFVRITKPAWAEYTKVNGGLRAAVIWPLGNDLVRRDSSIRLRRTRACARRR